MRKVIVHFTLLMMILVVPGMASASWPWSKPLLEIDQTAYTTEDYSKWWQYWQEEGQEIPNNIDSFVDWHLMAREAENMELDSTPEFKHKIEVFLKARTLMLLKYDEIDSKIKVTDGELLKLYKKDYAPVRLIAVLYFTDQQESAKFIENNVSQIMKFEELQGLAGQGEKKVFEVNSPQWLRPITTPDNWMSLVSESSAGDFLGPISMGEGYAVLYIVDQKDNDKHDFEKKKSSMKNKIRRDKEKIITQNLLEKLSEKYKLFIDEKLLAEIDLNTSDTEILQKTLISSTKAVVTVGYFIEQCKREQTAGKGTFSDLEGQKSIKKRVLSAMISNGLVSWESLDRHYEKNEPFKSQFEFYRQNRLVKELKKRILGLESSKKIGDDDAHKYYLDNISDFQTPAMARLVLVKDSPDIIQKIWAQVISKKHELLDVAIKLDAKISINSEDLVPLGQLNEKDIKVFSSLIPGEVSSPYVDGDEKGVMKLIESKSSSTVPFPHVKKSIIALIASEQNDLLLSNYLQKLRQNTEIILNEEAWENTLKELSSN